MSEKLDKKDVIKNKISELVKKCDEIGNTWLHYVVQTNDEEFAKKLIAGGCDVNAKNKSEDPPLKLAIEANQLKMVQILLNAGADCKNVYQAGKNNFFQTAVIHGCSEIVQLFIEMGMAVNVTDSYSQTLLHFAAKCPFSEKSDDYCIIMKTLIVTGADINARDSVCYTPIMRAASCKFYKGFELLLTMGAKMFQEDLNRLLLLVVYKEDLYMTKWIIDLGADVNVAMHGDTCLYTAARSANYEIMECLLKNGALFDLDYKNPLVALCEKYKESIECVTSILNTNDDPDKEIEGGNQKFHIHLMKCLDLLISHGANVNHSIGCKPIYIILDDFKRFHSNFLRVLLENGAKFDFRHPLVRKVINNSNGSKFPHLLLRHAAMFNEAPNRNDGPINFEFDKLNEKSRMDYSSCLDELELMKSTKIDDTNVSYFNILMDPDIGPYTRNKQITDAIEKLDKTRFSIYSDLLCKRFSREVEFQVLVKKATNSLGCILNWDTDSAHIILNNIIRYLDRKDIDCLALINV